ncbi:unnamed protein product [Moneuplotes crassus]|uniref:Uncharacterized protein n=1 Tax=Euplotes crassus TaxID=5936 RepID=A0AAD1UB63_EUPCR|nr:unnamed protein product [Moneuplotes crassus]
MFNLRGVSPSNDLSNLFPCKTINGSTTENEQDISGAFTLNRTQNSSILESLESQKGFPKLKNIKCILDRDKMKQYQKYITNFGQQEDHASFKISKLLNASDCKGNGNILRHKRSINFGQMQHNNIMNFSRKQIPPNIEIHKRFATKRSSCDDHFTRFNSSKFADYSRGTSKRKP